MAHMNTVTTVAVGPESSHLTCPHCHASIRTRVENQASTRTYVIAIGLFLLLCWPCVILPFCMKSCRNQNHYCPNCNAFLGTYKS